MKHRVAILALLLLVILTMPYSSSSISGVKNILGRTTPHTTNHIVKEPAGEVGISPAQTEQSYSGSCILNVTITSDWAEIIPLGGVYITSVSYEVLENLDGITYSVTYDSSRIHYTGVLGESHKIKLKFYISLSGLKEDENVRFEVRKGSLGYVQINIYDSNGRRLLASWLNDIVFPPGTWGEGINPMQFVVPAKPIIYGVKDVNVEIHFKMRTDWAELWLLSPESFEVISNETIENPDNVTVTFEWNSSRIRIGWPYDESTTGHYVHVKVNATIHNLAPGLWVDLDILKGDIQWACIEIYKDGALIFSANNTRDIAIYNETGAKIADSNPLNDYRASVPADLFIYGPMAVGIYFEISMNTDWCEITLPSEHRLIDTGYEIVMGEDAPGLWIVVNESGIYIHKQAYDTTHVLLRVWGKITGIYASDKDLILTVSKGATEWANVTVYQRKFGRFASAVAQKSLGPAGDTVIDTLPIRYIRLLNWDKLFGTYFYVWYGAPTTENPWELPEAIKSWRHWGEAPNINYVPPNNWTSWFLPSYDDVFDPYNDLYDSFNESALIAQLDGFLKAKFDFIVVSWWGNNSWEDYCLRYILFDLLPRLERSGALPYPEVKFTLYFEMEAYSDMPLDQLIANITMIIQRYGWSPYWLRIDGKPAIFFYDIGTNGTQPYVNFDPERVKIYYYVKKALWERGILAYFVADPTNIRTLEANETFISHEALVAFEAFNEYQGDFPTGWILTNYSAGGLMPEEGLTVIPGFWSHADDAPRVSRSVADYEARWDKVLEHLDEARIITVISWNEWHEGTQIEPGFKIDKTTNPWSPDYYYGYSYINVTREKAFFQSFGCSVHANVTIWPREPEYDEDVSLNITLYGWTEGTTVHAYYSTGDGWTEIGLTQSGNIFYGTIPKQPYGTTVTVKIVAIDADGFNETQYISYTVVDRTSPDITNYGTEPAEPDMGETVTFYADIYEPDYASGISSVVIRYNDTSGWHEESMSFNGTCWVFQKAFTEEVIVEYHIIATDNAGNSRKEIGYVKITDKTPPCFERILVVPESPTYNDTITIVVKVYDPYREDEPQLGVSSVVLWYTTDDSTWDSVTMNFNGTHWVAQIPKQPYGTTVRFYIEATDVKSNIAKSDIKSFVVTDNEPPKIVDFGYEGRPEAGEPIVFYAVVEEPEGASGVQKVWISYQINDYSGTAKMSFNGTHWIFILNPQEYGTEIKVTIIAYDNAGNSVTSQQISLVVGDYTPPVIELVNMTPRVPVYYSETFITLEVADGESWIESVKVTAYADGEPITVYMEEQDGLVLLKIPALPFGTNVTVVVIAMDAAGNQETFKFSYTVWDDVPPVIKRVQAIQTSTGLRIEAYVEEPANASGIESVTLAYRIDDGEWKLVNMTFNGNYWTAEISVTPGVQVEYKVIAFDKAGNCAESEVYRKVIEEEGIPETIIYASMASAIAAVGVAIMLLKKKRALGLKL